MWRESPFVVARCYRARKDFKSLRDSFHAGEVLVFVREAYSHYDNQTGFFFSQPGTHQMRVWDIHDDEKLEIWRALFEEI